MLPLQGLKVLDLSTLLPGPYATMLLADMGAEVLRVESASRPDLVRNMAPQIDGQSAAFSYLNRGKKSLALNLKHPQAKSLIIDLVDQYDILIEQFRPGVMARLGLDYASLNAVNPGLIYCSITGYGQSGPYRDRAGHDINYLALSGAASHMGRLAEGPAPMGLQVADVAGGSQPAVIAILAAVIQRQQTGKGAYLDIAMADNTLALQALLAPGALNGEPDPQAEGHFLNGGSFYDYYRTADGRYMAVGSLEPQFKQRLLATLDAPQAAQFDESQLKSFLQNCFLQRDLAAWCDIFSQVDACVEPVLTVSEALAHPQFKARGMLTATAGGIQQPASALGYPKQAPDGAPLCGEQNMAVLAALGYSGAAIERLSEAGLFDD